MVGVIRKLASSDDTAASGPTKKFEFSTTFPPVTETTSTAEVTLYTVYIQPSLPKVVCCDWLLFTETHQLSHSATSGLQVGSVCYVRRIAVGGSTLSMLTWRIGGRVFGRACREHYCCRLLATPNHGVLSSLLLWRLCRVNSCLWNMAHVQASF